MSTEELLVNLRENLEAMPRLIRSLPPDRLVGSEGDGEWSPRQVVAHLADFEPIMTARLRMILTLDSPPMPHYDQAGYTKRFAGEDDLEQTLERFAVNRRANLRLLEQLLPEDWERTGEHPERGRERLVKTVEMLDRHDRLHLDQIRKAARL